MPLLTGGQMSPYCPGCLNAKAPSELCCPRCWRLVPTEMRQPVPLFRQGLINTRQREIVKWLSARRVGTTV